MDESTVPVKGDSQCCDTCERDKTPEGCPKVIERCKWLKTEDCTNCQWCDSYFSERPFTRMDEANQIMREKNHAQLVKSRMTKGKVRKW